MLFSEKFRIGSDVLEKYGAVDINFIADRPLFVDPMLIFNSKKPVYKKLHTLIVNYLYFICDECKKNKMSEAEIKTYLLFPEVRENLLGYSKLGNKGRGNSLRFGIFLADNISTVIETHSITKGVHLEKIALLDERVGKDRISDFTTNIILGFLADYTQDFATKYLDDTKCRTFTVDKAGFDYKHKCFVSKNYRLPFVMNNGRIEYVVLTPLDIVREEEQSINTRDMILTRSSILKSIDNVVLRTQINNYISVELDAYLNTHKNTKKKTREKELEKVAAAAFKKSVRDYPELLDYYIKYKEDTANNDVVRASSEVTRDNAIYKENVIFLQNIIDKEFVKRNIKATAKEEAIFRIKEFKRIMESCGGYKLCYFKKDFISSESDLQLMFKFVLTNSTFSTDAEVNNGSGGIDFKISKGSSDSQLIEFKLASNKKLSHVFARTASYERANNTKREPIVVVFFSSDKEGDRAKRIIEDSGKLNEINKTVFFIDCRNNKVSASNER
jgi:hypothetical protein